MKAGSSTAGGSGNNMVHVYADHALLAHKLALLRDRRTQPARFSQTLKEVSLMLLSFATADLPTREVPVMTPVGPTAAAGARRSGLASRRSCGRARA